MIVTKAFFWTVLIFFASIFYSFDSSAQQEAPISDIAITGASVHTAAPAGEIASLPERAFAPVEKTENILEERAPLPPVQAVAYAQNSETASVHTESVPVAAQSNGEIGKPVRFLIPEINIDARVEHIGLTPDGAVGAPEGAWEVSWFDAGPRPGQLGSAVISGHTGIWKDGSRSIFDRLRTVNPGTKLYVKDEYGATIPFVVKEMRIYGKDDIVPEIFNRSGKAYLNIITCHGTWLPGLKTYSQRLVVFAEKDS